MSIARLAAVFASLLPLVAAPLQEPPAPPAPRPQVFAAIFERGPAWQADKPVMQQAGVAEHVRNNRSLGDKLIGAAPFEPDQSTDVVVGMVVLTAADREEAQAWLERDPMVKDKVMTARLRRWRVDSVKGY